MAVAVAGETPGERAGFAGVSAEPHLPVLCRPARPSDRDEAFSFLAQIWDGGDYLPQVWDRWICDSAGLFVAAERGGRVVGLGRLVDLGGGEAWMEGLRVDPRVQRQGIGSHIHEFLLERWRASSSSVVRLATHASRSVVRAMCVRTGFEIVAELEHYRAEAEAGEHGLATLSIEAARVAADAVRDVAISAAMAGLMELDWQWASITADRLGTAAARGGAWAGGGGVLITGTDSLEGELALRVQAILPDPPGGSLLRRASRRLAHSLDLPFVRWVAPKGAGLEQALGEAGFTRVEDDPLLIYERSR
jgi:ribosomal protein S18 acetylase RimI-like enzyme